MQRKKKILIVSHDEAIRIFVTEVLRSNPAYDLSVVEDEIKGLEQTLRRSPDLIILDMMMPRMNSYHVTRMVRTNSPRSIPMIMLAHHSGVFRPDESRPAAVLTTPFDPMALQARVEAVLQRNHSTGTINPFIHLSGQPTIQQHIAHYPQFAVAYADLDNLAAFNESYGFTRGDQIIGRTKQIITQAIKTVGTPHDFVKHVDGDDFVFMTIPERVEPICRQIIDTFDADVQANERQLPPTTPIKSPAREQPPPYQRHSPISISIAVVTNLHSGFTDFTEIGEIAVELRQYLKTLPGSNYYINRRRRS